MDNFSKTYSVGAQTTESGSWRDCLWGGLGIKQYIGPIVDMTKVVDVPAMPVNLFSADNLKWLYTLTEQMDGLQNTYDSSLAVKYRVRNVPLKPDLDNVEDKFKEVLAQSRDGMATFFPKEIVPINIGSNDGLVKVVRSLWEDHKASEQSHQYKFVVADTNIFWRSIKVHRFHC